MKRKPKKDDLVDWEETKKILERGGIDPAVFLKAVFRGEVPVYDDDGNRIYVSH